MHSRRPTGTLAFAGKIAWLSDLDAKMISTCILSATFTLGWDSRDSAEHSVTKEVQKWLRPEEAKVKGNGSKPHLKHLRVHNLIE